MVYRALRRGAGSSVVAGDKDDLRSRLMQALAANDEIRIN